MNNVVSYLVGLMLALGPALTLAGGDPVAGKEKAQLCFACHSEDGNSTNAIYPRLRGQYADYMVITMKAYREGRRENAVMAPMMAPLSEQDMEDIAAYYANLPDGLGTIHR